MLYQFHLAQKKLYTQVINRRTIDHLRYELEPKFL